MAQINLLYVQNWKDKKTGMMQYRYRRKGMKSVGLPDPNSPDFLAEYHRASQKFASLIERPSGRTINDLCVEYYRSLEFRGLKPETARNYRRIIEEFRKNHGTKRVSRIETKHLNVIFHKMNVDGGDDCKGAAAYNLRKRLNALFRLAVKLGWRTVNPVVGSEAKLAPSDGHTPWSEADIAQFNARWPLGTTPHLALSLLVHTGVRRSDVVKMGPQHIYEGRISVDVTKSRKGKAHRIKVPIHPDLSDQLADRIGFAFLLNEYGRPFTDGGFGNWFRDKVRDAGLTDLSPHGLRKAAGRRLAEVGCTTHEIAALLGHKSLRLVEVYTADANQMRLADSAMEKVNRIKA